MTKITIIEAKDVEEKYAVGDWFIIDGDFLCVLTQTESSILKMISISKKDSNRFNDVIFNHHGNKDDLNKSDINYICKSCDWQKVSVEIKVIK